jgi:hypothetical protein
MMNTHAWHGKAPNDAQLENAFAQNRNLRWLLISKKDTEINSA